jgi:hypothetical protein
MIVVAPVLVIPVAARTANALAVPRPTGAGPAAYAVCAAASAAIARKLAMRAEGGLETCIRVFISQSPL